MKDRAKYTKELLNQISFHISQRPKYKYKAFVLTISESSIELTPTIYMYPDIHHQKSSDKDDMVAHILLYHLTHITDNFSDGIKYSEYFVPGTYKFGLPFGNRYRRWIKLK